MTIQKPIGLHHALSQDFSNDELADICEDLNVDVEDLSPRKSSRARELIKHAQRRNQMDKLIGWLATDRPETDFYPYLYLIINDRFNNIPDMQQLSAALGIDYNQELITKLGYFSPSANPDVIEAQSWKIYELMAEAERQGELLWILKQQKPNLDLQVFELRTPSIPPKDQGEEKRGNGEERGSGDGQQKSKVMQYEPFVLRINDGKDGVYDVEVLNSPKGEVKKIPTTFTLDNPDFKNLLDLLKDLWADKKDVKELGKKLQPLLFPDKVWSMFDKCRDSLKDEGKGLRILLRIDPPELSGLPWEYVFDETYDYLAQDKLTPIVRYPAESQPQGDLSVEYPLQILLVTANPTKDLKQLKVDREVELAEEALEPLVATGLAKVDKISEATVDDVDKALTSGKYHIFHFIGHGVIENDEGALALEDGNNGKAPLFASQLRTMVRDTGLRFAFLNSCETAAYKDNDPLAGVAQSLIHAGVPAVMAMQFEVPDTTSLLFSQELYKNLVLGNPLDQAVTEMRRRAFVKTQDMVFWGIPVLFMRAPDGDILPPDEEVAKKLNAYLTQSPLVRALTTVTREFDAMKGTLETDATVQFTGDLETVNKWAEGTPDAKTQGRIKLKLNSMSGLLDLFDIDANAPVMKALKRAIEAVGN